MRTRVPDWQRRLRDVFARYRAQPVVCGVSDCGTLWADAVEAVTGVDVLADLRGTYQTPDEAVAALARLGFADARALADARFSAVWPEDLHRGDLGFAETLAGGSPIASPAIIDAGHAFTVGPTGLVAFPRSLITYGWAT